MKTFEGLQLELPSGSISKPTQEDWCLAQWRAGRELTPIMALQEFGIFRLSERVRRVNKRLEGTEMEIVNIQQDRGTNYGVYVMQRKGA